MMFHTTIHDVTHVFLTLAEVKNVVRNLSNMVYLLPIPTGHLNYNIVHMEIINLVVAIKIWAPYWSNQKIKIYCDNLVVVEDKARDTTLANCARNIWLLCAIFNVDIKVVYQVKLIL